MQKSNTKKLQVKATGLKSFNFLMFLACGLAAYILAFNGNTVALKILAGVLIVDATVHVYKLVAVVK